MHHSTRLIVSASIAGLIAAFALPAAAQHENTPPAKRPAAQGIPSHGSGAPTAPPAHGPGSPPGAPGPHGVVGPTGAIHGPGPAARGPERTHIRAVGERGYSFHGPDHGRREISTFNERERAIWGGGRWHHEQRFGRLGYWWEVNGVWYYYDRPMVGPPTYVSEVEFLDAPAAAVVAEPTPVVVAPPPAVVVVPRPVYVPPPVVCVGPLCVR